MKKKLEKWRHALSATGQLGASKGELTSSRFTFGGESAYYFEPDRFSFLNTNLITDRFSAYEYQATAVIGYGWPIITMPTISTQFQIGPGVRYLRIRETDENQTHLIIQPKFIAKWQLSPNSKLSETLSADIGKLSNDYTQATSTTALTTKVIGNLSMQLSYQMRYSTFIPPESKNDVRLDTITNISVLYDF